MSHNCECETLLWRLRVAIFRQHQRSGQHCSKNDKDRFHRIFSEHCLSVSHFFLRSGPRVHKRYRAGRLSGRRLRSSLDSLFRVLVLQGSRVRHRLWLLAPPGPAAQYLLKAWRHGWSTRPPPWPGIVRTRDRRFGYCVRRRCVHMLPECGVLLPECARFRSWSSSGSCDGPWFFQTEYDIRRPLLLSNWTQRSLRGLAPSASSGQAFQAGGYPPPDSARKFFIVNGMQWRLRSKFFILLEFFADSSWQRGYERSLELLASSL